MVAMSRRDALLSTLFGAGALGLRALATGIPASILLNPARAMAAGASSAACPDTSKAQYLIMSTSGSGDPFGANVPGTYLDPGIVHPPGANMTPTPLTLAGTSYTAAAPWAALPQTVLDKAVFFHHATYTVVHGDEGNTLKLSGAVAHNDMLVSMLASQLAPCLGTVQAPPVCIGASGGSEAISYQGRVQPILTPQSLASVLTLPNGPLANVQKLRDTTLDALNSWYKSRGGTAQQNFIDQYATSQDQLRNVSTTLLQNLSAIKDGSVASQITAAIALIQMNISPVVTIHIPMGGDNHGDTNLANEGTQQTAGAASIGSLYTQLASAGLQDKVSFMMLNVFGRTMAVSHEGTNGRDHNGNHHATLMIGNNLKGGVVGGVAPMNKDYGSTAIDSTTGASNPSGDIPIAETFAAMGKTVGRAVGVDETYLDTNITGGKAVASVLV